MSAVTPPGAEVVRVLVDTDLAMGAPGSDIDDGFALALALADPAMHVDAVTTVSGNTDVVTATRLAAELLERLGHAHVPVHRGAATALHAPPRRDRAPADAGHGQDRPAGAHPPFERAAVQIAERVLASPGQLTVVALGPLTNVALALLLAPEVASAVREIVVMGGAVRQHTNLAAMPGEFNVWCDPDAAAVVLRSGASVRLVGLDATTRVRLTRAHATELQERPGRFAPFAGDCALEWIAHHGRSNPGDPLEQDSCAMHDPLAVAAVTRPELVTWRDAYVQVETASPVTRGVLVADLLTSDAPPQPNCRVAVDVDEEAFMSFFLERVGSL
jgi:purine nucleosidase